MRKRILADSVLLFLCVIMQTYSVYERTLSLTDSMEQITSSEANSHSAS